MAVPLVCSSRLGCWKHGSAGRSRCEHCGTGRETGVSPDRYCYVCSFDKPPGMLGGTANGLKGKTDSKVHGANMGPIWCRQDPDGPHVGPMNFAIWECIMHNGNIT